jgi:hypothetical protein
MIFDNSRTIIGVRIKLFAATVLFLLYIILAYVAEIIKFPLLSMSDTAWTIFLVAVYIIVAFLPILMNYQFISYSDDGEKIIIRYFSAGMFGGKKNSIEIYKNSFSGYKIESKYFGRVQSLILFQKFKDGVAKYPPVYISALTRQERNILIRSLELHSHKI